MSAKVHRSKISNTEWGLVIGVLILIDIAQLVLDLFVIGAAINRLIDVLVGLTFPFYLHIRGESMSDPKRLMGFLAAFGLEFIPVVDAFPLWTLDGFYNMALAKWRNKEADKQAAEQSKIEKQKQIQAQQEKIMRIQAIRQQQAESREAQETQRMNNVVDNDNEDLYEEAV